MKLITSSGLFKLPTKSYSRQKQEKVIDLELLNEHFKVCSAHLTQKVVPTLVNDVGL